MPEAHTHARPGHTNDIWRAWLMTGVRRDKGDKRRIRGAHLGLKRMLVEGMSVRVDRPYSWKEFSDALVRQAVGDAVGSLPRQDAELVKLAYFGGMSNRDISATTGLAPGNIERRLRRAIDTIAEVVERGRGLGQRALGAMAVWLGGRWFHESLLPAAQATAVAGMAAVLVAQPSVAPPNPGARSAPSATNVTQVAPAAPSATPPTAQPTASGPAAPSASLAVPAAQLPVNVPIATPSLPPLPKVTAPQL